MDEGIWDDYMSKESQKKSLKTVYKKGNKPHNSVNIGDTKIDKDGYLYIKIKEGNLQYNWKQKHRIVWEEANGKVPKGHKIIFADKNKRNFNLDNLVLVKNSVELIMNRNSYFAEDKEITKTGVNLAKIINKVNKIKKEDK